MGQDEQWNLEMISPVAKDSLLSCHEPIPVERREPTPTPNFALTHSRAPRARPGRGAAAPKLLCLSRQLRGVPVLGSKKSLQLMNIKKRVIFRACSTWQVTLPVLVHRGLEGEMWIDSTCVSITDCPVLTSSLLSLLLVFNRFSRLIKSK